MIVPGHGRISDEADLVEYRDMVTIVGERVDDLIRRGMTLAQVQAARPTLDYDGLYGRAPAWTAERFVEAAYRTSRSLPVAEQQRHRDEQPARVAAPNRRHSPPASS